MKLDVPDPQYNDDSSDFHVGFECGLWVARQGWTPCAMHPSYPDAYIQGYKLGYEQGQKEEAA